MLVTSFPYVPDTPSISGNFFVFRNLLSFFQTVAKFYIFFLKGENFYSLLRSANPYPANVENRASS
jgi:hypothetical protein